MRAHHKTYLLVTDNGSLPFKLEGTSRGNSPRSRKVAIHQFHIQFYNNTAYTVGANTAEALEKSVQVVIK